MPTVRACIWNIQNYGAANPTTKFGANSSLRNRVISDYVVSEGVEIILIMEVSTHAATSLQNLVNRLNLTQVGAANKDWAYSFCGSAITANGNNPLQGAGDITFMSDARSEGYAVVWRTNRASFTMVPSLVNIATQTWNPAINPNPPATTPLNFVTTGRGADNVVEDYGAPVVGTRKRRGRVEVFRALGGYRTNWLYPYDEDDNLMNHWPDLKLPTTSTRNPRSISWDRARRPAYVVVDLDINAAPQRQRLCPLVVYHAPSNAGRASFGAFMSGLSRELYVTNQLNAGGAPQVNALVHNDNVVMGGDYNYYVAQADWPEDYQYYMANFNRAYTGGAQCVEAPPHTDPDDDRKTTVQLLRSDHVTPIAGVNSWDYYRYAIDLVFMRESAVTTVTGERSDFLEELLNDAGGAIYGATLGALRAHLNGIVNNLAGANQRYRANSTGPQHRVWDEATHTLVWKPMIAGSWGGSFQNWTTFMNMLNVGQLTAARQAAEFYHIFVSDHLPLRVDIDY